MQTLNFTAFKLATLWLGLFIVLYQPAVFAAVYKCTDAKGNLTYSDRPCQIDSQSETIKLKGTPPPFNPEDYCQAVFEADYTLKDRFTNSSVKVRKGEKVLAGGLGDVIPNKLFYLTEEGVVQYTFDSFWLDEDLPPHHFTCVSKSNGGASISGVAKLLVVINNVALYTDKALTKLACRLTAGTKLGKGSTTRLLSVEKTEKTEEYTIGSIEMDTLADICDRHTEVYFKMRKTSVGYVAPLAVPLWKMAKF